MTKTPDLPQLHTLWDFQKPDESETRFRELLPQAEASGDLDYRLEVETQIARTFGLRRRFDESHAILDKVEPQLSDETPRARIRYLLERGRTMNSSQNPEKARPLFDKAWEHALTAGADALAVDAAHMIAIVAPSGEKLEWNHKGVELAERSDEPLARSWLGSLYNNIGWDYHDQGDFEKALEIHTKGRDWFAQRDQEKNEGRTTRGTLIAEWSVAKQLRCLGRTSEALPIHFDLLEKWKAHGEEDGFVCEEIGECLLAEGKKEESAPYFQRAHTLLSEIAWVKATDPDRLERLRKLGTGD